MSADGDAPELLQAHLDRDASDVTSWYTGVQPSSEVTK
jgi:hypothetical protein